tara:strand:+ start:40 stop:531 length:492 start_codon:yes stop_codon:yes gene_type:complete
MASHKMGRPRKPDIVKELEGTARKDRQVTGTAVATGSPQPPKELSDGALRVWRQLAPQLIELGLLAEVDASTFATYCQSYADWLELNEYLAKLGPKNWYFETQTGYRQIIPEVTAREKAFQAMQRQGGKFGLDPSSRSGIPAGKPASSTDPVEEFLFQPRISK